MGFSKAFYSFAISFYFLFSTITYAQESKLHIDYKISQEKLKKAYEEAKKKHFAQKAKINKARRAQRFAPKDQCESFTCQVEQKVQHTKKSTSFTYNRTVEKVTTGLNYILGKAAAAWDWATQSSDENKRSTLTNQPPEAGGIAHHALTSGSRPEIMFSTQLPMSDPDGTVESVEWEFGDGTIMAIPAEELTDHANINHFYPAMGPYTVKLRVYDDLADFTEYTASINVVDNQLPRPNFFPSVDGNSVTFTAVANDPENDVDSYHWDFGDGTYDSGPTLDTVSHTYDF